MAVSLGVSTMFGTWKVLNEHWLPPSFLLPVSSLPCNSEFQMWVLGMLSPEWARLGETSSWSFLFTQTFDSDPTAKKRQTTPFHFGSPMASYVALS